MPVVEMSHPVVRTTVGFWGKIPSRGDFVGIGLSPGFVAAWDDWVSRGIAASRDALGERWMGAWMEAPVWCFTAASGLFGSKAVVGLWMPSVDRAGRAFPLVIAGLVGGKVGALPQTPPKAEPLETNDRGLGPKAPAGPGQSPDLLTWLVSAETVGRAALADLLDPEALFPRIPGLNDPLTEFAGSTWWTEGAPRVAPCWMQHDALPDVSAFASMLEDAA